MTAALLRVTPSLKESISGKVRPAAQDTDDALATLQREPDFRMNPPQPSRLDFIVQPLLDWVGSTTGQEELNEAAVMKRRGSLAVWRSCMMSAALFGLPSRKRRRGRRDPSNWNNTPEKTAELRVPRVGSEETEPLQIDDILKAGGLSVIGPQLYHEDAMQPAGERLTRRRRSVR
ncbi:hypothetical protein EYF80_024704 [Liparis tanakae]|uniref:Uncharacterized protein n=1 Tax=Liparis tanakae TaxID=230148 RepID=A0A4Z2HIJ8_9TELE|nr:hypothetical protein EYF80_024704 [Liparis tanakae]